MEEIDEPTPDLTPEEQQRVDEILLKLHHAYRKFEPDLIELKGYAARVLSPELMQSIEDGLTLRGDLRALVHELRHPSDDTRKAVEYLANLKARTERGEVEIDAELDPELAADLERMKGKVC